LRAAAKNARHVLSLCDPADYPRITAALEQGDVDLPTRVELAAKAFAHTAAYDALIASWLSGEGAAQAAALAESTSGSASEPRSTESSRASDGARPPSSGARPLPNILGAVATRARSLRYGENPHQS